MWRGRAESVEAVDSSAAALATAEANARANDIANIQFRQADVFDFLLRAGPEVLDGQSSTRRPSPNRASSLTTRREATRRSICERCGCWSRAEFW